MHHQGVVNLVLAPHPTGGGLVEELGHELDVGKGDLERVDAQLEVHPPLGSPLHTNCPTFLHLQVVEERMAAAGVGVVPGKGDLLVGALRQQELILRVEDHHAEGPVEEALVDVLHQVADLLRLGADDVVILVDEDAGLIQQVHLLLVKGGQVRLA